MTNEVKPEVVEETTPEVAKEEATPEVAKEEATA